MSDDLSNLNIENLFYDKNKPKIQFGGKLDINSLFGPKNEEYVFDSRVLLELREREDKKVNESYNDIYKKCCESIKEQNLLGFNDMIYQIPRYSEYKNYSCRKCCEFIKSKLDEQKLSVKLTPPDTIYVSWNNLKEKINGTTKNNHRGSQRESQKESHRESQRHNKMSDQSSHKSSESGSEFGKIFRKR